MERERKEKKKRKKKRKKYFICMLTFSNVFVARLFHK